MTTTHDRGEWATSAIFEAGRQLGLEPIREFRVTSGRIDVAWLWKPVRPLPPVPDYVPIAGFEIESSWRTRKHVKGDIYNLQNLGAPVGVIVLLGDGGKVESLRKSARAMVEGTSPPIAIWSEPDIERLTEARLETPTPRHTDPIPLVGNDNPLLTEHAGKYRPLWRWLVGNSEDSVSMTFADVEGILGFRLPDSCRRHPAHWSSYEGSAVARAIVDAGWKASRVSISTEAVTFVRQAR